MPHAFSLLIFLLFKLLSAEMTMTAYFALLLHAGKYRQASAAGWWREKRQPKVFNLNKKGLIFHLFPDVFSMPFNVISFLCLRSKWAISVLKKRLWLLWRLISGRSIGFLELFCSTQARQKQVATVKQMMGFLSVSIRGKYEKTWSKFEMKNDCSSAFCQSCTKPYIKAIYSIQPFTCVCCFM